MKRLILLSALVVMPVILAVGAPPSSKVNICHYDTDAGAYYDLSVGPDAATAHLTEHEYDYLGTCYVC